MNDVLAIGIGEFGYVCACCGAWVVTRGHGGFALRWYNGEPAKQGEPTDGYCSVCEECYASHD